MGQKFGDEIHHAKSYKLVSTQFDQSKWLIGLSLGADQLGSAKH